MPIQIYQSVSSPVPSIEPMFGLWAQQSVLLPHTSPPPKAAANATASTPQCEAFLARRGRTTHARREIPTEDNRLRPTRGTVRSQAKFQNPETKNPGTSKKFQIAKIGCASGPTQLPPTTSRNVTKPHGPSSRKSRRGSRICTRNVCIQPLYLSS